MNKKQQAQAQAQTQVSSQDKVIEAFNTIQSRNEMAEVLKELFDENKIFMIGDMSKEEIQIATRIYMLTQIKDLPKIEKGLIFYTKFLLSQNRKSRREILDAIKGYYSEKSMMSKLNPFARRGI